MQRVNKGERICPEALSSQFSLRNTEPKQWNYKYITILMWKQGTEKRVYRD